MKRTLVMIIVITILSILLFILTGCSSNENINTQNELRNSELEQLKARVEQDELDYGNNYKKFTFSQNPYTYKRQPDRIYFKSSNKEGFYLFEKDDEKYKHLLEVSEDRMFYSVMEDFNLWCFTPDSIDTMMTSGDNYIIFDYDNGDLSEYDTDFQQDLIFRFPENTRLYRLVSYLSYYKDLISRDKLGKTEFTTDTRSGWLYMIYPLNVYSD